MRPQPRYDADITVCRACGSPDIKTFLSLGKLPLSGHLLRQDQLNQQESRYPMDLAFCPECSLVQLVHTVAPEKVFQTDYPYFSSVSEAWVNHCKQNVEALIDRFSLNKKSLAVEIASNDGYLLQHFVAKGIPVLGIDPSEGPVKAALAKGIPTRNEFFTKTLAQELAWDGIYADVILGNNVLAHVADTNGFVAGVATLLAEKGVAVFEVPHVKELIDRCEFDTCYHEHLCYYSLKALKALFLSHGLAIFDVEQLPTHGGSIRIYAQHYHMITARRISPRLIQLLNEEDRWGVKDYQTYATFAKRVEQSKENLTQCLIDLAVKGKRVVAYGAAAKGGTLLNSCGIDTSAKLIEYVVDKSPAKQGRYMTGSRLPIYPTERLLEDQPDYALLLTWNFKEEILAQQAEYRRRGGKFIIPIPEIEVV